MQQIVDLTGLMATWHETEVGANVPRTFEAVWIVDRGHKGKRGELARTHVILLISLHY